MPTDFRPPLVRRLRAGHWLAIDMVGAALLTVWILARGTDAAYTVPAWVAVVVEVATVLPVAVRRVWPVPVLGVVLVASFAATMILAIPFPYVGLALAVSTVASRGSLRRAVVAVAVPLGAIVASAEMGPRLAERGPLTTGRLTIIVMAWALGVAVRQQRAYAAVAQERAVSQERMRIARELHDVVAHGMSLIAVQAGVARYVVETQPAEAARALASIEETSRSGLREMRQLLSTLRPETDHPSLEPAPGLADLDTLVTRAGEAGVPVTVEVRGPARSLPRGVELSAYRIVQEALTNVVKHVGPARAAVVLDYRPDALGVEVTDDGHRSSVVRPGGHGIVGMRERVAVYGGTLHAGPTGQGFRVSAVLPLAADNS